MPQTTMFQSVEAACRVLERDPTGREAVGIWRSIEVQTLQGTPLSDEPIVILEGADGVGKSTLAENLQRSMNASVVKTPPKPLGHFRQYFDSADAELRRAFYILGNYVCAYGLRWLSPTQPIIVDRFWPSSAAYALACDLQSSACQHPEIAEMPKDLVDLLSFGSRPIVFLVLDLPEKVRASRVRGRPGIITQEEESLERDEALRGSLARAYAALRLPEGQVMSFLDASGGPGDVLQRALTIIRSKMEEFRASPVPLSVNWHYTRQCNYTCKFCFHTAKTSFFLPQTKQGMDEAKQCLRRLQWAGMQKLNFSGGEPFLHEKELGELCRFCKEDLALESVSIVSNGSKITGDWIRKHGSYVDILAISCDSFQEEINLKIGRGKGSHLQQLQQIRQWCEEADIKFKVNTVVNKMNINEDMRDMIRRLNPVRWKVFQCLLLEGENAGEEALRNARRLTVSSEEFQGFLDRHSQIDCLVPEDNEKMKDSYLILDEFMRFLNCTGGAKTPTASLRDVPVISALKGAGFDSKMFLTRGGVYDWTRQRADGCAGEGADLEDLAGSRTTPRRTPLRTGIPINSPRPWGQVHVLTAAAFLAAGVMIAVGSRSRMVPAR
ncbi:Rsad2 [Symbiodinium microadriaticum]|nr:Rsad2 [Symbiodinium microadriaticum]CAE7768240.1 Rsad2 [Symbiodinium sp. KB8]